MQFAIEAWVRSSLGGNFSVQSGIQHDPFKTDQKIYKRFQPATFFCFGFSMALVPVMFIYPLVQERAVGAKHLQSLSGVNPIAYWLGTFSFDIIVYVVIVTLLMLVFMVNPVVYVRQGRWFLILTVLLIYGFAMFPYLYATQFLFRNPSKALVFLLMFTIFIGTVASFVMTLVRSMIQFEGAFYLTHLAFTLICPNYSLTSAFFFFIVIAFSFDPELSGDGITESEASLKNYFKFKLYNLILYENLVSMTIVLAVSWVVLALVEYRVDRLLWYIVVPDCGCLYRVLERRPSTQEDDDVKMERVKISTTPFGELLSSNVIVMHNLRKHYLTGCRLFVAVHGTSICLPPNECLGLLGQNGAGKSTTFKVLTGDVGVSSGDAYINGMSIKTRMKTIQTMMGYCPQQDALHDTLTGRETLYLYARIRGVPQSSLGAVVQTVIDFVTLSPHENKITQYYSGGNKRKLSVGISIIGNPKFIMLDEPTAGMDPIARRKLWDVLHLLRNSGKTLVLTSHSMEECEALCTRIAIMVHGNVLCLGSSQHLKSKYGKGYTVILHAAKDADGRAVPLSEAERHVLDTLGNSQIFAKQEAYTDIQIPENIPLSFIFEVLEKARGQFKFQYYTVQQTSLEQVFLRLLKVEESIVV
ncbi:ATP-binding cassette sub- A member 3 [Bulinus truncatus]|nr:ATP-binding cassette sub- A member 3 [Bulinus truncatus]